MVRIYRPVYLYGEIGATDLYVQPPLGLQWHFVRFFATHDDTTNRALSFNLTVRLSGGGTLNISGNYTAAVAASTLVPYCTFGTIVPTAADYYAQKDTLPPPLTYDMYMRIHVAAITAGKRLRCAGVAIEIKQDIFAEGLTTVQTEAAESAPPVYGGSQVMAL